jgi:hypothetical protein
MPRGALLGTSFTSASFRPASASCYVDPRDRERQSHHFPLARTLDHNLEKRWWVLGVVRWFLVVVGRVKKKPANK